MATTPSQEFLLGELTGEVRRMAADLGVVRAEGHAREAAILGRIEQHDQRDDDRFVAVGARLLTIERKLGVYDTEAEAEARAEDRHHDRRNLIHTAIIAAIAALAGGILAGALPPLVGKLIGGAPG